MPRMGRDTFVRLRLTGGGGSYILLPVLTTTQRDALTAAAGMVIYNSTTTQVESYNGSAWVAVGTVYGDATFLPLAGGTMTGNINMGGKLFSDAFPALVSLMAQGRIRSCPLTGWTALAAVGSGATTQGAFESWVQTGATANSSQSIRAEYRGMSPDLNYQYFDFDKDFSVFFCIYRLSSDTQAVARFQFKEVATAGALGENGVGLEIANYAITGESYGSSRGTVDLGVTMTDLVPYEIEIRKTSGKVEFFVAGVSKGSITTAAAIPAGNGTVIANIMQTISNGAAGGTNVLLVRTPHVWVVQAM